MIDRLRLPVFVPYLGFAEPPAELRGLGLVRVLLPGLVHDPSGRLLGPSCGLLHVFRGVSFALHLLGALEPRRRVLAVLLDLSLEKIEVERVWRRSILFRTANIPRKRWRFCVRRGRYVRFHLRDVLRVFLPVFSERFLGDPGVVFLGILIPEELVEVALDLGRKVDAGLLQSVVEVDDELGELCEDALFSLGCFLERQVVFQRIGDRFVIAPVFVLVVLRPPFEFRVPVSVLDPERVFHLREERRDLLVLPIRLGEPDDRVGHLVHQGAGVGLRA